MNGGVACQPPSLVQRRNGTDLGWVYLRGNRALPTTGVGGLGAKHEYSQKSLV